MNRPSVDEYFMAMAYLVSERSTCLRRKVGAVIVKNKQVLSTGYNGAPKNLPHCKELGGCMRRGDIDPPYMDIFFDQYEGEEDIDREEMLEEIDFYPKKGEGVKSGRRHELCRAAHAEQNAIVQAAVSGVSIKGSKLYCTTYPCVVCGKMLINSEIDEIIYDGEYKDPLSENMLNQSEIDVKRFEGEKVEVQETLAEYIKEKDQDPDK
ncbi:MAG: dCMP deaminase family protein [Candidatus Thermoplasmatota archaeon]|nr:dCMP deaminase family protein [Candidatus Thermoplasmatota archaeon]